MVYSDVIKKGQHKILPAKKFYTMADVKKVWLDGFLDGISFTDSEAKFIVICTAIFHNAKCSKALYTQQKEIYPLF